MVRRTRTSDRHGLINGRCSKFFLGCRIRQTLEEGRMIYRPKRCEYTNKMFIFVCIMLVNDACKPISKKEVNKIYPECLRMI